MVLFTFTPFFEVLLWLLTRAALSDLIILRIDSVRSSSSSSSDRIAERTPHELDSPNDLVCANDVFELRY